MVKLSDQVGMQAGKIVDEMVAKGRFDAVQDLAAVFPINVVADPMAFLTRAGRTFWSGETRSSTASGLRIDAPMRPGR